MTTFNTGNPIGSTDARDLSDNAENFDVALGTLDATWTDRLGVTRDSFEGRLAKGSFYRVGTFEAGYTLTNMRQTLEYSGVEYSWSGSFPKVVSAGATPASSGGIGAGAWTDKTDLMLRYDLASSGKDSLIGHANGSSTEPRTVKDKIDQFSSTEDYGYTKNEFGYNPLIDSTIFDDAADRDEDFLLPRHLGIAKDLYGIRRSACVASIRANNDDAGFNPQIVGVSTTQELANYGSSDNVALFSDITSKPYETWEIVTSPSYLIDGFTATGLDFTKIKKGQIIFTDHSPKYVGIITGHASESNKVFVTEWRKTGSVSSEVPPNTAGLHINPVGKIWAINANTILKQTDKPTSAVVCEFGLVNNKVSDPSDINGLDVLLLDSSTYGGTAAIYTHAPGPQKWKHGVFSTESSISEFYAALGIRGFVASNVDEGFVFKSTSPVDTDTAIAVLNGNNLTSSDKVLNIGGDGRVKRMPLRTFALSGGETLTTNYAQYIYGGSGSISVNVSSSATLVNGDTIRLKVINSAATVTLAGGSISGPSGAASQLAVRGPCYCELVYLDGIWYVTQNGIINNTQYSVTVVSNGNTLTRSGAMYLYANSSPISLNLSSSASLVNGDAFKLKITHASATVTLSHASISGPAGVVSSLAVSGAKTVDILYYNGTWYVS